MKKVKALEDKLDINLEEAAVPTTQHAKTPSMAQQRVSMTSKSSKLTTPTGRI